jgi:hypothetical protein
LNSTRGASLPLAVQCLLSWCAYNRSSTFCENLNNLNVSQYRNATRVSFRECTHDGTCKNAAPRKVYDVKLAPYPVPSTHGMVIKLTLLGPLYRCASLLLQKSIGLVPAGGTCQFQKIDHLVLELFAIKACRDQALDSREGLFREGDFP